MPRLIFQQSKNDLQNGAGKRSFVGIMGWRLTIKLKRLCFVLPILQNRFNWQPNYLHGVLLVKIDFLEITNYRKLKSVRIDLAEKTTLFVGANNSGKTAAMEALGHFLVDHSRFNVNDFTLSNWGGINTLGEKWISEENIDIEKNYESFINLLPSLDVWVEAKKSELHYVNHIIPTLEWEEGLIGIRLRYEPKDFSEFIEDFIVCRKNSLEIHERISEMENRDDYTIALWPKNLHEYLTRKLNSTFEIKCYSLDPKKVVPPTNGIATPQKIESEKTILDGSPLKKLIRIDEINAQRGFGNTSAAEKDNNKLNIQLREYYSKHLNPIESPELSDIDALQAISNAQNTFDERLKSCFSSAIKEVEELNYPGITDPKLKISTKIEPIDGLNHESAVQYELTNALSSVTVDYLKLPESYNGLGYQNLISIAFKLMGFRDSWMKVGKASVSKKDEEEDFPPPLHLVLIEEPEAHLHAQVQQIFIRKAYDILRKHKNLGDKNELKTQLIISTHSSHIAHESKFSSLRYFRRIPACDKNDIPISTVINLSSVFGKNDDTDKFVIRYLKATHCDLFFADAAIIVEGPAERILIPHLIRTHFPFLNQSYITILEIGGSHAHRLKNLITSLNLISLIITDIDPKDPSDNAVKPSSRNKKLLTSNTTLSSWVPNISSIDTLYSLSEIQKELRYDDFFSVYAAYQTPVKIEFNGKIQEFLPNTFEDSLVYNNIPFFSQLKGNGLINKFKKSIDTCKNPEDFSIESFSHLKSGNKAEFALDILFDDGSENIETPNYIRHGLEWLEGKLKIKQLELINNDIKKDDSK